jgi:excisionase family DNA binding protein
VRRAIPYPLGGIIMQAQTETRLLRIPEVAARLDVTEARAYELARTGALPSVRIGRQIRVSPDALGAWIENGGQPLPGGWRRDPEAAA